MSLVLISGSSDGLGLLAARLLVDWGHEVTLHARSAARAEDARRSVPEAKAVAIGDLSSIEETRRVAEQVNALGRHDAVIHNAWGWLSRSAPYRDRRRPLARIRDQCACAVSADCVDNPTRAAGLFKLGNARGR